MTSGERAICSRLKEFREATKWPQVKFSKAIGISRDQLASIEYGRTPLRYAVFKTINQEFDLSPVWLATGKNSPTWWGLVFDVEGSHLLKPSMLFSEAYELFLKDKCQYLSDSVVEQVKSLTQRLLAARSELQSEKQIAPQLVSELVDLLYLAVANLKGLLGERANMDYPALNKATERGPKKRNYCLRF